jgi:hypothetical protein
MANILNIPMRYAAEGGRKESNRPLRRNPTPKKPIAIRPISNPQGSGKGTDCTQTNPNAIKNASAIGREDVGTNFIVAKKMTRVTNRHGKNHKAPLCISHVPDPVPYNIPNKGFIGFKSG